MKKSLRNSISIFKNKNEQIVNHNLYRSITKKLVFTRKSIQRNSLIRHKSTFINNQLPKAKNKIIEIKEKEKENEKINEETLNFININRKATYRNNNINQILKSLVIKSEINKIKKLSKRNSFYKRKVGTKHFYLIRKQINQRLKNKYKSPYMDYLIEKGYYEHYKKSDYPKYYNYYMIGYLMNNKRCQLTLRYYDNIYFYNLQEYLIRFFGNNEIFIIMSYLLYFVYDKDINTVVINKKKILSNREIQNMYDNLIKSNYNFLGKMEIFDDIAVYYRNANNPNISKLLLNLENVKPIIGEEIHYLYAKDVPTILFPNSFPNFFPLVGVILNYIKKYINKQKFLKLKTNNNEKDINDINSFKRKKTNNNDNIKIENNILMNLSLSLSKDKNINDKSSESEEDTNLHNSKRRLKVDIDIYDVETLVDKLLNGYYGNNLKNKNNKKSNNKYKHEINFIKKETRYKRRTHRFKTMQSFNLLKSKKTYLLSPKAKNINKNININSLIKSDPKIDIFKTSLRSPNLLVNKIDYEIKKNSGKNQITFNQNPISTKDTQKLKIDKNMKFLFVNNKEEENNKYNYTPLNILKFSNKINSLFENNNTIQKKYDIFKDFINNENKSYNNSDSKGILSSYRNTKNIKRNNSCSKLNNNNYLDKSINTPIKEVSSNCSSQTIFFNKFKDTQTFISNSTKNKYNINKYISLKKINKISRNKINSIKNKNYYKGASQKPFSTFSGINFDEKVINVWENNKIDGINVKDTYITNNLFTKIKNFNVKNQKDYKRSSTFNEIIRFPNIYISNLS